MAVIEMNTIPQDAVIRLAELQDAPEWLTATLDEGSHIGLATVLRRLTGIIQDEVFPYIRPIMNEAREVKE